MNFGSIRRSGSATPVSPNWYEAKKIYRLKEDQAFSLSLELGRREKFALHLTADFLPLLPKENSPQPVPQFVKEGGR
jgi:hypothetical protein